MMKTEPLRLRLQLNKKGRTRFLSHTEFMRTVMMVARRSRFPIQYGGKNFQKMRISFSPPLPLGFTSDCELVDIMIDEYLSPADAQASMSDMMPEGIGIVRCRLMGSDSKPVGKMIDTATFSIDLPSGSCSEKEWTEAAERFLNKTVINFERVQPRRTRVINIRKGVHGLEICTDPEKDGLSLFCVLDDGTRGTVKPKEVIEVLCDLAGTDFDSNEFTSFNREGLYMRKGDRLISPMDVDLRKPAV